MDACADAMVTLMFAEVQRFGPLFQRLINEQPPERQQRLGNAFQLLVSGNGLSFEGATLGRIQRTQFRANLKAFLSDVRVFMRIK